MNKDSGAHEELRRTLEEIRWELKNGNLSPEQRRELEIVAASAAGALLSSWLPLGMGRKLIMGGLFLVGLYAPISGNTYLLLAWLFLPIFSPRIIGMSAYAIGKFLK